MLWCKPGHNMELIGLLNNGKVIWEGSKGEKTPWATGRWIQSGEDFAIHFNYQCNDEAATPIIMHRVKQTTVAGPVAMWSALTSSEKIAKANIIGLGEPFNRCYHEKYTCLSCYMFRVVICV